MTRAATEGLIIASNRHSTPALAELIEHCGWQVSLNATPRGLRRHLLWTLPKLTLFWLDRWSNVPATMDLVRLLGSCAHCVRRIVVANQLPDDLEVAARTAGAHYYLAADGNATALVETWLPHWRPDPYQRRLAAQQIVPVSRSALPSPIEFAYQASEPP